MITWLWLRASWLGTCECGCFQQPHTHYREGTNCALCDCRRYWPRWARWPR